MPPSTPTRHLPCAGPELVRYSFTLSARGERYAYAWLGSEIALLVEASDDRQPSVTAPPHVRAALLRALDAVYLAFVRIAGERPPYQEAPFRGRVVIQVPLDNSGAAGLAGHGVAGISVGVGLVRPCVERWERAVSADATWLPQLEVAGLDGLRFADNIPELASIDQVFFYELARNFWHPWFNRKFDWACDGNPECWGWWTVGMNNAMAIIVPDLLNLRMFYFGQDRAKFRNRMVAELDAYAVYRKSSATPFDAWKMSRMPWKPTESVNDLMTAFIVASYERFGGEMWIKGFFRALRNTPDINCTEAGGTNFQAARDNLYRIWSYAAVANLHPIFANELGWHVSKEVKDEISAQFPTGTGGEHLSLGLEK